MGHEVTTARDGHRGLKAISSIEPDVVISDVRIPFEQDLVTGIAEVEVARPEMSTILLGSSEEKSDLLEGMRIGADDFVLQPVDYDLLEAKIASNLRSGRICRPP